MRRLARSLGYPLFLLVAAPGCQAFHMYRPVVIRAQDAETKKPIPGAEVHLTYPLALSSSGPWEPVGTTGDDGTVRLKAAPYGEAGILLDVAAPGYMTEQKSYPVEAVKVIEPSYPFESDRQRPVNFVVEMYAGPAPAVELVLPAGYRGTVRAAVRVQDDAPFTPGQRVFSYAVPPSGDVQVTGPPLLRRVHTPDFRARYADGPELSRQAKDDEIGFWCLKTEGATEYFVVGTRAEFEELRRSESADEGKPNRSSGGGKGGGRGSRRGGRGGGGGGNQPPPDSGSGGTGS
jgi:hypothetical protein